MQRLKIFGSIFIILTVIIINITIESNAEGGINVSIKVNGNGCFENGIEYRSEGNICVDVSSDIGISNGVISITQNGDKKEYTYNYEECPEKISETLNATTRLGERKD